MTAMPANAAKKKKKKKTASKAKARKTTKSKPKSKPKSASGPKKILVRGAEVVSLDETLGVGLYDVLIEGDTIVEVGPKLKTRGVDEIVQAKVLVLMPGLVQAHVHLCQTIFRGLADDMELLAWLRERIWPMEGALEAEDMKATARLGIAELLLGGTTSILDMGSVRHTHALFEEAQKSGIRYTGGKTIMDQGQGYPAGLRETTDEALSESVELCKKWHGTSGGRIRYAFSPRFVLACTEDSMVRCVTEARKRGALLHTHAAENSEEIQIVRGRTGKGNIEYLHSIGFTGKDVLLAHCIWVTAEERRILRDTETRVVHCPSANLKLASGIARVDEYLNNNIHVALGSDGAGCNNRLDGFTEMRTAALLHKVRGGPTSLPAHRALRLATRDGALALGLENVGCIAPGMKADCILLDLRKPHTWPSTGDLISRIVYSAQSSDVHSVMVDGEWLVREGTLTRAKIESILAKSQVAAEKVSARVN